MYAVPQFDETRPELLRSLMSENPLGTLIMQGADGLAADHIPFEIDVHDRAPFGVLRAHVARANPLLRNNGGQALVVFHGPSAYITPSLYEEKAVSGKVVPTWNYAAVHAHGTLRVVEDPAYLFALLERLTVRHEAARSLPWSIHDAPRAFIDKIMAAIVGIEIPIARLQGKWKLSQDHCERDQRAIAAASTAAMAAAMAAAGTSR